MSEMITFRGTGNVVTEVSAVDPLPTTGSGGGGGAITSVIPGTGATNLGKAEDAPHTTGDVGVEMLAVRNDAGGPLAGATGDYIPLTTDANGNLRVVASGSTVTQFIEDSAHTTGDLGFEVLTKRTDTAASSAGTDGDYATMNTDALGHTWAREGYAPTAEDNANAVYAVAQRPLAVSTYSWTRFQNLGGTNTLNVKATPGNVFSLYCHNLNVAARYIQLHNTATTPAGGAVPVLTYLVPAQGAVFIDSTQFGAAGDNFTTGIAFGFSTTESTFTGAIAADQVTNIHFV